MNKREAWVCRKPCRTLYGVRELKYSLNLQAMKHVEVLNIAV